VKISHNSSVGWDHVEDLNCDYWPVGGIPPSEAWGIFDTDQATYDLEYAYDECKWVLQVTCVIAETYMEVVDPDFAETEGCTNVESASDVPCDNVELATDCLTDPDPSDDDGPPLGVFWCHSGIVAHEEQHRSDWEVYYEDELAEAIAWCESNLYVIIDCADADTITCQDALALYQDYIDAVISDAYWEAMNSMDDPGTPIIECEVDAWDAFNAVVEPILDELPEGCTP